MVFGRLEWSALDATLMNSCGSEHKGPREEKRKNKKNSQNKKNKKMIDRFKKEEEEAH